MHHLQSHPPFGHHPGGNRGVDPPGEQRNGGPPYPHRQSAGAGGGIGVDIGGKIPDLHVDHHLGSVHIRLDVGKASLSSPPTNWDSWMEVMGKDLSDRLDSTLKVRAAIRCVPGVGLGGFQNGLLFLGTGQARETAMMPNTRLQASNAPSRSQDSLLAGST